MSSDDTKPDDLQLRLGYPSTTPEGDARSAAAAEWRRACTREGVVPAGEPAITIERGDPVHQAMGQYVVVVVGEVSDGTV